MTKLNLDSVFPLPVRMERQQGGRTRTYDVRITLNKSGKKKSVVRFGFINLAATEFGAHPFIEASDIEYTRDRIYFRSHDGKEHRNIHALSTNGKTRQDNCYFAITPNEKAEKMYRMNWIGKTFPLLYDPENELFYIATKEEN